LADIFLGTALYRVVYSFNNTAECSTVHFNSVHYSSVQYAAFSLLNTRGIKIISTSYASEYFIKYNIFSQDEGSDVSQDNSMEPTEPTEVNTTIKQYILAQWKG
jgi:hypothetical protein